MNLLKYIDYSISFMRAAAKLYLIFILIYIYIIFYFLKYRWNIKGIFMRIIWTLKSMLSKMVANIKDINSICLKIINNTDYLMLYRFLSNKTTVNSNIFPKLSREKYINFLTYHIRVTFKFKELLFLNYIPYIILYYGI